MLWSGGGGRLLLAQSIRICTSLLSVSRVPDPGAVEASAHAASSDSASRMALRNLGLASVQVTNEEATMSQVIDGGRQVRWSQVEEAFYVGNYRGNFVGYIDQDPGGMFRRFDHTSTPQGESTTLEQAMTYLNEQYFASAAEGDWR